ncbi:MAG: hypothetical protein AAFZ05_06495 [Pseudomonadota bacterium]
MDDRSTKRPSASFQIDDDGELHVSKAQVEQLGLAAGDSVRLSPEQSSPATHHEDTTSADFIAYARKLRRSGLLSRVPANHSFDDDISATLGEKHKATIERNRGS